MPALVLASMSTPSRPTFPDMAVRLSCKSLKMVSVVTLGSTEVGLPHHWQGSNTLARPNEALVYGRARGRARSGSLPRRTAQTNLQLAACRR